MLKHRKSYFLSVENVSVNMIMFLHYTSTVVFSKIFFRNKKWHRFLRRQISDVTHIATGWFHQITVRRWLIDLTQFPNQTVGWTGKKSCKSNWTLSFFDGAQRSHKLTFVERLGVCVFVGAVLCSLFLVSHRAMQSACRAIESKKEQRYEITQTMLHHVKAFVVLAWQNHVMLR